jgi:hypothetical protein
MYWCNELGKTWEGRNSFSYGRKTASIGVKQHPSENIESGRMYVYICIHIRIYM